MAHPTSPSHRRGSPVPRPLGAALGRVAAVAVALVLVMALVVAFFMTWLPGDAPDLYSLLNADIHRPITLAGHGTGSATIPVFEIWPSRKERQGAR